MQATVRFWDNSEIIEPVTLPRKRGYAALFFPDQKILTYRVDVFDRQGQIIETWEHQFWTELIEVGRDESKRSSVSSQLKQASVIETP